MTCSVLNHLSNLDKIINNPEEIALKAVALAETNSKFDWITSHMITNLMAFSSWIMNGSRSSSDKFTYLDV